MTDATGQKLLLKENTTCHDSESSTEQPASPEDNFYSPRTPQSLIFTTPTKSKNDDDVAVQEKLQSTLEKHGIARQNASKFFVGLLKDKDFKKLFKASLDSSEDDSSDDEALNVPMTRSKLKEYIHHSPHKVLWANKSSSNATLPKFTEIHLPENDDDDDEYNPVIADESFGSAKDSSLLGIDVSIGENEPDDITGNEIIGDGVLTIDSDADGVTEQQIDNRRNDVYDVISKRTRSKHSLRSTSLDVLQAAFNPPDASDDMRGTDITSIEDYDWQKWLVDLMKDDGGNTIIEEEDNVEEDPDFSVTAELDKPEEEDTLDYVSMEVPAKEVLGLIDEIENMDDVQAPLVSLPAYTSPVTSTSLQSSPYKKKTKKTKAQLPLPLDSSNDSVLQDEVPVLQISKLQIELLEQQMQQHVQLLAQTNILCRNTPYEEFDESKELVNELFYVSRSQMNKFGLEKSYVASCNLEEAVELAQTAIPPSEPSVRLQRFEKLKHHVPIPSAVAEILGRSKVSMYRELLPITAPGKKSNPRKVPSFLLSEDCLLVLGLNEMTGIRYSHFELVSQHLMPARTGKQLSARFRNVTYCRNSKDAVNPIMKYHTNGSLPKPNSNVAHVDGCAAQRPVDMEGDLPCWVLALKPIYKREVSVPDLLGDSGANSVQSTPLAHYPLLQTVHSTPIVSSFSSISMSSRKPNVNNPSPINLPISQISVFQANGSVNVESPISISSVDLIAPSAATSGGMTKGMSKLSQPDANEATVTSVSQETVVTSEVQPTMKLGRRRSAGKSIQRMKRFASSSSSSESEDGEELENPKRDIDASHIEIDKQCASTAESEGEDCIENNLHSAAGSSKNDKQITTKVSKSDTFQNCDVPPAGGYLQKLHPRLMGKKGKLNSRDIRKIKSSAKMMKSLEEETIVQLDPYRTEKEKIFASGYLERVRCVLKDDPSKYENFIDTLIRYSDGTKSPVDLHKDLSELLKDWPDLIQGFVPFLMPEQAQECGLHAEQETYARARKFLRQLEIQFAGNPERLKKILNVFHTVAETAIYREEEMMKSILNLLKGYPYLQDEFITFFDSQPPPKMLFDEDFEEVDFTEELLKDPNLSQFEQVTLTAENLDPISINEAQSSKRPKKRTISRGSPDEHLSQAKFANVAENKENISPEAGAAEDDEEDDIGNTDYESEDALMEDDNSNRNEGEPSISAPTDIAVISEDAQSCSPFKRITSGSILLRPETPTGIAKGGSDDVVHSTPSPVPLNTSSSGDILVIPATPGKMTSVVMQTDNANNGFKPIEASFMETLDPKHFNPSLTDCAVDHGNDSAAEIAENAIDANPVEHSSPDLAPKNSIKDTATGTIDINGPHDDDEDTTPKSSEVGCCSSPSMLVSTADKPAATENQHFADDRASPAEENYESLDAVAPGPATADQPCDQLALEISPTTSEESITDTPGASNETLTSSGSSPSRKDDPASPEGEYTCDTVPGIAWTRQDDELILTSCRQGITSQMFSDVAERLGRTTQEVEVRLSNLLSLFNSSENEERTGQESEEDGDIYSDSSAT